MLIKGKARRIRVYIRLVLSLWFWRVLIRFSCSVMLLAVKCERRLKVGDLLHLELQEENHQSHHLLGSGRSFGDGL
jgi:hypothetical protein